MTGSPVRYRRILFRHSI